MLEVGNIMGNSSVLSDRHETDVQKYVWNQWEGDRGRVCVSGGQGTC